MTASQTESIGTPFVLEGETIFPVPEARRHGNALSLCLVWIGANQNIMSILTGMIYPRLCHLSLGWSILAILAGNLIGGVFMALHAAQGPRLGIPQMQQTRGQFGSVGSLLVVGIVIVMYVGFTATLLAIGRDQALEAFGPAAGQTPVWISAVVIAVLCVIGHGVIERFIGWFAGVAGVTFLLLGGVYLFSAGGGLAHPFWQTPTLRDAIAGLSLGVLWQIAYAPYVSDYTRYLPSKTGEATAFRACLAGGVGGTAFPTIIGAMIGCTLFSGTPYDAVRAFSPVLPVLLFTVMITSTLVSCTMQIYCAALSSLTFVHTFRPAWHPTHRARGVAAALLLAACVAITVNLGNNVLDIINDVIELLLAVLSPWTAINLVDYYLVQHGAYDMPSLFRADGGIYGRFNRNALVCYAIGIAVQIPFLANALYTGPAARALGAVDVSWAVGIIVPGVLYRLLARRTAP
ncbi:purine-cytosine permease [Ameyamaea chiangmaiensis NBRC 103196]|uniref:Cytosine permease n=1 Tax=Ameyamaea chiangmaiensis TaxID=442969 RepID=A0A850PA34_9PROT|nr:cytosine permease [Ameyamaea chiangmaiensis]MBS4076392.1 cytosine permease [Ameyamaea chiangmaiensis]NVN40798.1 cytosine permease [Ameyamaea chiangmaiensis]GBQ63468.1 purine-cytosine permease [Ameyamaea chiangmaiensis NBRC 103196]